MKIGDLPQKKWFSWSLIAVLVIANIISYNMTSHYFKSVNPTVLEDVEVGSNYLGSGNRLLDLAREILRFFKNP